MRRYLTLLTIALTALAMTACGSSDKKDPTSRQEATRPTIVASTSMWAAVAKAVAGDRAEVKAVITSTGQDPHGYEVTAQDKLLFSKATITVVNGGGYDDWATTVTSKNTAVINASTSSGLPGAGSEGFNEHVWYSPAAADKVARAIAAELTKADADSASTYQANLERFTSGLTTLTDRAAAIGKKNPDQGFIATEPVGTYLFQAAGLTDLTPTEFVEQSESDAGPSVAVIDTTVKLISSGRARVLAVNAQTTDAVSDKLIGAAKQSGVPTVEVYEVLPNPEMSYLDFLGQAVDALAKAANS